MRIKVHFFDTNEIKIGQWEVSDHILDIRHNDLIQISGRFFEIINSRSNDTVGMGISPYDKIVTVWPLDNPA